MDVSLFAGSLAHAAGALAHGGGSYFEGLVAALVILAAYAPGRSLAGRIVFASAAERVSLAVGLGLAAIATLVFVLGLAGWFTLPAAVAGLAALQLPWLAVRLRQSRGERGPRIGRRRPPPAVLLGGLAAALLVVFVGTLALYPPLGFDATLYHLPAARAFLRTHRLPYLPDARFPVFPQLGEALFALGLAGGDDRAARLVELAITALAALALYAWASRHGRRRAGLWAGALWLGSPYVVLFGADAYVDATLAFFGVLAVAAADRVRDEAPARWAIVAGALAGAAAATKYFGLFFVLAIPVAILAWGGRARLRSGALALGAGLAVAAPWYARIALLTGNPVFPYFPRLFGPSPWGLGDLGAAAPAAGGGVASTLGAALRALALGQAGPWQHWVGAVPFNPFLLALAPALLLLARRPRRALGPLVLGLAYAPCVALVAPDPRYLLPALAWAAAAGGLALDRLLPAWAGAEEGPAADRPPRRASVRAAAVSLVLALAFAAPGAAYAAYRISVQGPVPATRPARRAFLALRRPGYGAIDYLNGRYGESYTVYCLWGEDLRYFARGRFLGDWNGPARFATVTAAAEEGRAALTRELRGLGAGFLLVIRGRPGIPEPAVVADPGPGYPLLYRDARSRLYAVTPATSSGASPPPAPGSPAGRRSGSDRSAAGGG